MRLAAFSHVMLAAKFKTWLVYFTSCFTELAPGHGDQVSRVSLIHHFLVLSLQLVSLRFSRFILLLCF